MTTWTADKKPESGTPLSATGWARVTLRGIALGTLVFGSLGAMMLVRVVEAPVWRTRRPVTPWITRFVCRNAFRILRIDFCTTGIPMTYGGAVVANHTSWLDIFALNAKQSVYFVSKSEVAGWPGIGWLARATGTLFIERRSAAARQHQVQFHDRLAAGHQLLFFPEGTSTDGLRILPFKSTLFEPYFNQNLKGGMKIQPVSVVYSAPKGEDPRFYGWWGDMDFAGHFLKALAAPRQGRIAVQYHPPIDVADMRNRKELAQICYKVIRDAHRRETAVIGKG